MPTSRMIIKRPMELLSTSVTGGVVASSGRSSGTPFRQSRMAAALSRHQIRRAIQRLGCRIRYLIREPISIYLSLLSGAELFLIFRSGKIRCREGYPQ